MKLTLEMLWLITFYFISEHLSQVFDTMLNKIIEIKTNNPPGFDFCRGWISSSDEDLKS